MNLGKEPKIVLYFFKIVLENIVQQEFKKKGLCINFETRIQPRAYIEGSLIYTTEGIYSQFFFRYRKKKHRHVHNST